MQCLLKTSEFRADSSLDEDQDDDIQSELEEMMDSLVRRIVKCQLDDFELVSSYFIFLPPPKDICIKDQI